MSLLEIENLSVEFSTADGMFRAVDSLDVQVTAGDILAIVGESGSGKSVSMLALMGLLPWVAKVTADRMMFNGIDMLALSPAARRKIIGHQITMMRKDYALSPINYLVV